MRRVPEVLAVVFPIDSLFISAGVLWRSEKANLRLTVPASSCSMAWPSTSPRPDNPEGASYDSQPGA